MKFLYSVRRRCGVCGVRKNIKVFKLGPKKFLFKCPNCLGEYRSTFLRGRRGASYVMFVFLVFFVGFLVSMIYLFLANPVGGGGGVNVSLLNDSYVLVLESVFDGELVGGDYVLFDGGVEVARGVLIPGRVEVFSGAWFNHSYVLRVFNDDFYFGEVSCNFLPVDVYSVVEGGRRELLSELYDLRSDYLDSLRDLRVGSGKYLRVVDALMDVNESIVVLEGVRYSRVGDDNSGVCRVVLDKKGVFVLDARVGGVKVNFLNDGVVLSPLLCVGYDGDVVRVSSVDGLVVGSVPERLSAFVDVCYVLGDVLGEDEFFGFDVVGGGGNVSYFLVGVGFNPVSLDLSYEFENNFNDSIVTFKY